MNLRKLWDWLAKGYAKYRQLINMGIVATVAHLGYGVLNQSAIPPYVALLGLTTYIGIIYATFLVTETLFKTPMGSVEDRLGVRPVYVVAAFVGAGAAFIWTFMSNLWLILLVRLLDGAGSAAIWTATIVGMGATVGSKERTTAMGAFLVTYLGGLALGPIIGGYANDVTHSKLTSFYLAAGFFALAGLLAIFLVPHDLKEGGSEKDQEEQDDDPDKEEADGKQQDKEGETKAADKSSNNKKESKEQKGLKGAAHAFFGEIWLALKSIPDFMLIAFMAFFSFGLIIPVIKLFAMQQLGMSETTYGLVVLPVALVSAVASLGSGWLAKKWGRETSVHVGLGFGTLMMYGVPLVHGDWEFGVLAALIGVGFVIGMPAWLALVEDMADPDIRGAVIGALGTGQGMGILLGTAISSFLYTQVPIDVDGIHLNSRYTPFIASAVALTITFVLTLVFVRKGSERHISKQQS